MEIIKDDNYYVSKAIAEIELVVSYSKGMSLNDLMSQRSILDAIVFRLIQVAEIVDKLSADFKEKHKEIKWKNLKGFRNKLVHDYGSVDLKFVYQAVKHDAPTLKKSLLKALKK